VQVLKLLNIYFMKNFILADFKIVIDVRRKKLYITTCQTP